MFNCVVYIVSSLNNVNMAIIPPLPRLPPLPPLPFLPPFPFPPPPPQKVKPQIKSVPGEGALREKVAGGRALRD